MFCKFCGRKIDPTARLCPHCGERQEDRRGGNGFWDILEEPNPSEPGDNRSGFTAVGMNLEGEPARKKNGRKAAKLQRMALALSLVCLLYGLVSSVVMGVKLQALEKKMETLEEVLKSPEKEVEALKAVLKSPEKEMEALKETPKSREEEPPRKDTPLPAPETEAPAAEKKPAEPVQKETVEKDTVQKETIPESVPLPTEGLHFFHEQPKDTVWEPDGVVLFATLQEGLKPEKVEWQYKKTQDESWNPVTNNENLVLTNDAPGKYVLRIKDPSFAAAWFRCVITVDGRTHSSEEARVLPSSGKIPGVEG